MNEQTIIDAFEILEGERHALYQATERAIAAKTVYENMKADKLLSGEITGKNEMEREAKAHELLPGLYGEMLMAEQEERAAKASYDTAKITVDKIQAVIAWTK